MILLLFLMSGRDDISRLHIFVQKGAGRGGGGGGGGGGVAD